MRMRRRHWVCNTSGFRWIATVVFQHSTQHVASEDINLGVETEIDGSPCTFCP